MARRALPSDPYQATCHALLIYAAPAEVDDGRAQALAEAAVSSTLGEGWTVTALGPGARDYRVAPASGRPIATGRAWLLTRRLRQHRDVADAEPAIVQPGLEPPPGVVEDRPTAAVGARDLSAEAPLPCAASDHEWSLSLCKVRDAWALSPPTPAGRTRGEGIIVGHPDTGYTRHREIWDDPPRVRADESYDFVKRQADAADPLEDGNPGHGTTTASVIMSTAGNLQPFVSGVAPAATILPLRVTPRVILLSFDRLAEAIHYATDKGCHVISMSLGGPTPSRTLARAISRAVDHGVIVLAAAGNVWPFVVYPARLDQVIACAACNCQRKVWKRSASGDTVDVTAPGESVWVARPGRGTGTEDDFVDVGSGTSYAVATTAGACALWLAFHGRDALIGRYGAGQLAAVFKELLMRHGVDTPAGWRTDRHGAGILNVEKLLQAPLPPTPPADGLSTRSSMAPRNAGDLDQFLTYFPDEDPARVRQGLARALQTTERELPVVLAEFGDELVFHVATNPELRARIAKPAGPKKRGRRIATRSLGTHAPGTVAAAPDRFTREASTTLQRLMR